MASGTTGKHENWSSGWTFMLAAIGGAVGLGNIWKFPYMVGENGGAAFVLVYMAAVVLVAIPILMAELMIGKRGHKSPGQAMRKLAEEAGKSHHWQLVGWAGIIAAFLVFAFFGAIAAWAIAYIPLAASGALAGLDGAAATALFDRLKADPLRLSLINAGYLALSVAIVARGIRAGIEKCVKYLMPALFILLLALVIYAAIAGEFIQGVAFMLRPDFGAIDGQVMIQALGQAFLSIGIAAGVMMTFGAYLPKGVSILRAAVVISLVDALVAILAGLAIFPIIFAHGLSPSGGPGLAFVAFPLAIGGMPGGALLGTLFFILLVVATLTSSIAVLEPAVSWAEEHKGLPRGLSATGFGFLAWLLGNGSYLSFAGWGDVYPLGWLPGFGGRNIFASVDFLLTNLMLPLGGLAIALFAGWLVVRERAAESLAPIGPAFFRAWRFLIRYIAPIGLLAILAAGLL